jgi:membrane protease YdiL (CAAX protease family)
MSGCLVSAIQFYIIEVNLTFIGFILAHKFGYQFRSNYKVAQKLSRWSEFTLMKRINLIIIMPVLETFVFGNVLIRLTKTIFKCNHTTAVLLSSIIFVMIHETSDPVLIFIRLLITISEHIHIKSSSTISAVITHSLYNTTLLLLTE